MDSYSNMCAIFSKQEQIVYRFSLIQYAKYHGVSAASRHYGVSRTTVRKWCKRYEDNGRIGLKDARHGPKRQLNKTPETLCKTITEFRKKHPHLGAQRIKIELELSLNQKTIHKIIKNSGLVRKTKCRYRKRQDLRAIKQQKYAPGTLWMNDVKYLTDLPSMQVLMQNESHTPRFQYTMRDVHSGATFVGYAKELSEKHAQTFVDLHLRRCRSYGLSPENMIIQTDNGSEFSGARYVLWQREGYSHTVHKIHGAEHRFIPPGCSNANADVESFHRIIEREFFDLVQFQDVPSMLDAYATYILYFNTTRYSLSKTGRTPYQILEPILGDKTLNFLAWQPVDLDAIIYPKNTTQSGNHLTPLAGLLIP